MKKKRNEVYDKKGKRLIDLMLSFVSILLLSPVILITALAVRLRLGSPVIFKQKRPGKDERIFEMYKFRTMTDEKDDKGHLLSDDVRLTKFGQLLRSTSLDELPSLFNILKGDMSIIGPRPLLVEYLPLYNEEQRRRHEIKPGLSGLAQVKGRNLLTWNQRFLYDVYYVDNVSFKLDCWILLLTFKKVFIREGIHSENSLTMEPFKGNKKEKKDL